jgi:hypothetical protein
MGLQDHNRANVRFQIFQEIMARQSSCDPARAMEDAIILAQRLLCDDHEPPLGIARKGAANKPRLASVPARRAG